ncbi:MAG: hypothetical protein PHN42_03985 [Bacilli bacterium]|nr:hypothetical protein [Bacilli bacterium]
MNNYLIPANSKKSLKIFGMFYPFDLILLGSGTVITFILIALGDISSWIWAVISLLPMSITAFLVFPIPNYHNVLTFLISLWEYFTTRRNFIWKGWCVLDEKETDKE